MKKIVAILGKLLPSAAAFLWVAFSAVSVAFLLTAEEQKCAAVPVMIYKINASTVSEAVKIKVPIFVVCLLALFGYMLLRCTEKEMKRDLKNTKIIAKSLWVPYSIRQFFKNTFSMAWGIRDWIFVIDFVVGKFVVTILATLIGIALFHFYDWPDGKGLFILSIGVTLILMIFPMFLRLRLARKISLHE